MASSDVTVALALINQYAELDRQIKAQLADVVNDSDTASQARKIASLNDLVQAETAKLDDEAKKWGAADLVAAYVAGRIASNEATGGDYGGTEGLQAVQNASLDALLAATLSARRKAAGLARTKPENITTALLRTTLEVKNPTLRAHLAGASIGVTYKNGARVSLGDYVAMVIRTQVQTAYNLGILHASQALGISTFLLSDGAKCGLTSHNDPNKANGLIVTAETALAHPLSHPNCVRKVRPLGFSVPDAAATTGAQPATSRASELLKAQKATRSSLAASRAGKVGR